MEVLKDPFSYCNVERLNTTNRFQRALVFQGGGSLGAYEAGVYKATYELLSERDIKLGREGKPIFHIVAGTSIGAMNASCASQLCKRKQELARICRLID